MQRIPLTPRDDWQQKVESAGLTFHSPEGMDRPYWDESAAYEFTAAEIDTLEAAGNTLQEMCLSAAEHVIKEKRYVELDIPAEAVPAIEWAWENEPPALYGRFDLSWAGASSGHAPKLLEYNADTPTSLLEAAVIQWSWLEEQFPNADQFNSIHEKLIAKWKDIDPYLSKPIYFAGLDNPEDQLTLVYLRDTAQQAGLQTLQMFMEEIGWNDEQQAFLDPDEQHMFSIFKLYPWEAMVQEEFGIHAVETYQSTRWIEPIWKMLLSNKGILPILWQLYPNHDLLLEAHFDGPHNLRDYVRKPIYSREGANITIVRDNATIAFTGGPYNGPQIYQALAPEARFDNRHPILGLWMIDQECCGMGIRESAGPITDNLSSFVPHTFR
ncbi:MAG TPA: glutathionylspermidine synthase family protein [Edaphobacter sp.]|nr:glutathionylspermidine synthase family protein [Edaphobacter sp.]